MMQEGEGGGANLKRNERLRSRRVAPRARTLASAIVIMLGYGVALTASLRNACLCYERIQRVVLVAARARRSDVDRFLHCLCFDEQRLGFIEKFDFRNAQRK